MTNGHPYFPLYTGRLQLRKNNSYKLFYTYTRVIIKGENIKKNNYIGEMNLVDEGTTIFNMLNYPTTNCDGNVLDIFL